MHSVRVDGLDLRICCNGEGNSLPGRFSRRVMKILVKARIVTVVIIALCCAGSVRAQGWPEVFEPNQFLTVNLQMSTTVWNIIRKDLTFNIQMQASFWADGESPIVVGVRRKSSSALPNETDPFKVSLKIDFNQYVAGQEWHGLRKLSLEMGDDVDPLAEGLACNLHRMAVSPQGYGYDAWRANWVKLYVNGIYRGVYVNNEQYDRAFLRNRGLDNQVWMYKYVDTGYFVLEEGDELHPASDAVLDICYLPFANAVDPALEPTGGLCLLPDDPNMVISDMNDWVNMQGMLSYAAVNAFASNPDDIFSYGGHNAFFMDFSDGSGRKRRYHPWDMDQAMQNVTFDIYTGPEGLTGYQQAILGIPLYRRQYNRIMKDLLNGPLSQTSINAFMDSMQPILSGALAADTYNKFPPDPDPNAAVANRFASLKTWVSDRTANVLAQVGQDQANLNGIYPVDFRDFAILTKDWQRTGGGLDGDVNNDLEVDFQDIKQMAQYWLRQ